MPPFCSFSRRSNVELSNLFSFSLLRTSTSKEDPRVLIDSFIQSRNILRQYCVYSLEYRRGQMIVFRVRVDSIATVVNTSSDRMIYESQRLMTYRVTIKRLSYVSQSPCILVRQTIICDVSSCNTRAFCMWLLISLYFTRVHMQGQFFSSSKSIPDFALVDFVINSVQKIYLFAHSNMSNQYILLSTCIHPAFFSCTLFQLLVFTRRVGKFSSTITFDLSVFMTIDIASTTYFSSLYLFANLLYPRAVRRTNDFRELYPSGVQYILDILCT